MVYVVVVQFECISQQTKETILKLFTPVMEYAKSSEPQVLTYLVSFDIENPLKAIVYERYVSKEYCEQVHAKNPVYQAFQKTMAEYQANNNPLNKNFSISRFHEADLGFSHRNTS